MSVPFDDDDAGSLVRVAREVDGRLRAVGVLRRGAVETAVADFVGGYSLLFKAASTIEAEDRGRLASVLGDLAGQVEKALERASEERDRQSRLADWRERDAERDRRRERENFLGDIGIGIDAFFDPKPSETPVAPPTITAVFSPRERIRTSGGGSSSTLESSADPDHLRTFVSQARADDSGLSHEFIQLGNAWTAFTSSCSWVPLGSTTFLGGFKQLLVENRSDADWIENVANAFAAAGGGVLLDHALDLVATAVAPLSDQELLDALSSLPAKELAAMMAASPELKSQLMSIDPAGIHSWWTVLNPQTGNPFSPQQDLLLTKFPLVFGNLEGLPYTARNHANRIALTAAIADIEAQITQLQAPSAELQEQLGGLQNILKALQVPDGWATRQLISFTEDNPPLAAVSIGDLDTADSVTYAVPGMGTTSSKDMTGWTNSGQNLHDLLPKGSAVVAWIGYETPPEPKAENGFNRGVLDVNRAVAGGHKFAGALAGLAAVRGEPSPQVNIVAHSYGTTTAAVALTQPGIHVDNFITLGSAGQPDNVDNADDLNADQVYSGHARDKMPWETESGDQWAWIGRDTSRDHKVNPMDSEFGSHAFGTDTGSDA